MDSILARRRVLALLAGGLGGGFAVALTRGGDAHQSGTPAASPGASPVPAFDHPTGADDLVLRIETVGGFVPSTYFLTDLPELSL